MLFQPHYVRDYRRLVRNLIRTRPLAQAAADAVGGDFEWMGSRQRGLLLAEGMRDGDYLIDVGCGSGRTAFALREMSSLRYLGIDVVPELVGYAQRIVDRNDWRFEVVNGLSVPERDNVADIVAMFSVVTHLSPKEGKSYVVDAMRVLKPGGRLIASFLDPLLDDHRGKAGRWFWQARNRLLGSAVRNQMLNKDQILSWSRELNASAVFRGVDQIGQSYVVLTK